MKKIEKQMSVHQLAMTVEIDMPMYNRIDQGNRSPKHTQVIAFANCSLSTKPHCTQNTQ
jgi:hypothetical protein